MSRALADFLIEQLAALGHATSRAMFGGISVYLDGVIVAIVVDDAAYLKTDAANRPEFEAAGSEPFTYEGASGAVAMSYWEIPAEVLEDPEELRAWTMKARAASVRARGPEPAGGRRRPGRKPLGARQPRRTAGSRRSRGRR